MRDPQWLSSSPDAHASATHLRSKTTRRVGGRAASAAAGASPRQSASAGAVPCDQRPSGVTAERRRRRDLRPGRRTFKRGWIYSKVDGIRIVATRTAAGAARQRNLIDARRTSGHRGRHRSRFPHRRWCSMARSLLRGRHRAFSSSVRLASQAGYVSSTCSSRVARPSPSALGRRAASRRSRGGRTAAVARRLATAARRLARARERGSRESWPRIPPVVERQAVHAWRK